MNMKYFTFFGLNIDTDGFVYRYETGGVYTWMNWLNLFGFYWGMSFVSAYR